jgi:hypothetical protein
VATITELRHFLIKAWAPPEAATTIPTVVLIDHHGAQILESDGGALHDRGELHPLDPHGFHRHLEHRKEADYRGQRVPEADEFYERVAQRIKDATAVRIVSHGTGKSNAGHYLAEYLHEKHGELAQRLVGGQESTA